MIDSSRCLACGRFFGKNTKKEMVTVSPEDYHEPMEPLFIHDDYEDCPTLEASIEYAEGVSNYRVAVE